MPATLEKILVRGANPLGDGIMTTPALQRLREARPDAHIVLLTSWKFADLWRGQPFLNEVVSFSASENIWNIGRRLREGKFSTGIVFPNSLRSALELWLAGIPRRIGLKRGCRGLFLTDSIPRRPEAVGMHKRSDEEVHRLIASGVLPAPIPAAAHQVYDYLHLTAQLGSSPEPLPPRISVSEQQTTQITQRWSLNTTDGRPWFGLNPGAEYGPAKRWPTERFAAAAIALQNKTRCRWMLFGGAADRETTRQIATQIQTASGGSEAVLNLAGQTNLAELAAALKMCRLVLTNDTGPMHLAAAVGTPVVVLFGSTAPELTGPTFSLASQVVRRPVPCAPCFRRECPIDLRCLKGIDSGQVVEAALRVLGYS
jgi:heptosyltransferase-2